MTEKFNIGEMLATLDRIGEDHSFLTIGKKAASKGRISIDVYHF